MERILIIGNGAREHALAWKVAKDSPGVQVFVALGNPGCAEVGECVLIPADNPIKLAEFAKENRIGFTIVGPERSLAAGVADEFKSRNLEIFGPTKEAAMLETNKAWAKRIWKENGIPTAEFRVFYPQDLKEAEDYIKNQGVPIVVKQSGIAAGKGVVEAFDLKTALGAVHNHLKVGPIVVEEYLEGNEVSVTAVCNGLDYIPFQTTEDQKKASDGGPNTGGMGVYSPVPYVSKEYEASLYDKIVGPTLRALAEKGIYFSGILYPNIMLTKNGPKVLEFNTRLGDPETQTLLPRLKTPLLDILTFNNRQPEWLDGFGVSVSLVSEGYPGKYKTGKVIEGVEDARKMKDILVFHAGTSIKDGNLVTAGGRVLSVVALGETLEEAVKRVYKAVSKINFEGMYYRKDIAQKCL